MLDSAVFLFALKNFIACIAFFTFVLMRAIQCVTPIINQFNEFHYLTINCMLIYALERRTIEIKTKKIFSVLTFSHQTTSESRRILGLKPCS